MKNRKINTPAEVRANFLRKGISQAQWARAHEVDVATVSQVISGKNAGTRGVGHKVAVLLGLKDGEIVE